MYLLVFVIIILNCINVFGQTAILENGCYVNSIGDGYKCDGKYIIPCANNQPNEIAKVACADNSEFADNNANNSWCYSYDSYNSICGPSPGTCYSEGVFPQFIGDVDPCKNYYMCILTPGTSSLYIQLLFGCPPGEYFSNVEKKCRVGACVVTTTIPPITSTIPPTTTTISTAPPTTTTPPWTTTISTTPPPTTTTPPWTTTTTPTPSTTTTKAPKCESLEIKADPRSCRNYFVCNRNGKFVFRSCLSLAFDTSTNLCKPRTLVNCGLRPYL